MGLTLLGVRAGVCAGCTRIRHEILPLKACSRLMRVLCRLMTEAGSGPETLNDAAQCRQVA